MTNRWKKEYYFVTASIAVATILLVGCLTTTTHNPMKPKESQNVAPVTSEVIKVSPVPVVEEVPYRLLRLHRAFEAALRAFSSEMDKASDEDVNEFKKIAKEKRVF